MKIAFFLILLQLSFSSNGDLHDFGDFSMLYSSSTRSS